MEGLDTDVVKANEERYKTIIGSSYLMGLGFSVLVAVQGIDHRVSLFSTPQPRCQSVGLLLSVAALVLSVSLLDVVVPVQDAKAFNRYLAQYLFVIRGDAK